MKALKLTEAWRILHPAEKDFTFFSSRHKSYSRIDYFLVSQAILDKITEVKIGPISISDHAPVVLALTQHETLKKPYRWSGDNSIFELEECKAEIEKALKEYFCFNSQHDSPPDIIWEAHKTVIRGILMKLKSQLNKNQRAKIDRLSTKLLELENSHKLSRLPKNQRSANGN